MLYAFKLGRKLRGEEPYCPEKGGKGGSSDKSAKYAAEAQKYAADLQNQQFNTIMNNLKPFTPLADKYVGSLENLSSLEGQGQALNQYYNSQQYKDLAGQARYQSLAAAEATGGLGSTATSNQLATIAPTLGQQWLSGQMNNYPGMKQIGSELSGRIYDIAYETRYMSEETKKSLLREMKNLDTNNFVVKNAQPMLAKLRGEEWIH